MICSLSVPNTQLDALLRVEIWYVYVDLIVMNWNIAKLRKAYLWKQSFFVEPYKMQIREKAMKREDLDHLGQGQLQEKF